MYRAYWGLVEVVRLDLADEIGRAQEIVFVKTEARGTGSEAFLAFGAVEYWYGWQWLLA